MRSALGGDPVNGVWMINHVADPVGRFIGSNPPTGGIIPEGSSWLGQASRAITGQKNSPHNCPPTLAGCGFLWGTSSSGWVPVSTVGGR
jgi:filamentous hemagglutinin